MASPLASPAGVCRHSTSKMGTGWTRFLTVMGGRAEALARFRAYRDAGADLVLCYPVAAAADPFSSILGTVLAAAPSPAVER